MAHTTRQTAKTAKTAVAAMAVAMLMAASQAAEGVDVMFRDTPQAGGTGVLVAKTEAAPKSAGSEIDSRRDSDRGSGTESGTTPEITAMDGVQRDGGSWFCKALASTGLDEIVDVSLLCD